MTLQKLENFINGDLVHPSDGKYLPSFNPSLGIPHFELPDSTEIDVNLAVAAASAAFPTWSRTSRSERSAWMMKIAAGIQDRLQEFAEAESRDQGKPVKLALAVDIPRAIHNFRFFATYILHMESKSTVLDCVAMNYVQRMPVGVVSHSR